MTLPIIKSVKTDPKKPSNVINNGIETTEDVKEISKSIRELHRLKNVNYTLAFYNVIALSFGLLFLLSTGLFFILHYQRVVIFELIPEDTVPSFEFTRIDELPNYKDTNYFESAVKCFNVPKEMRFDCHPEDGASELACIDRGCCWDSINGEKQLGKVPLNTPYCFYSSDWKLYEYQNVSNNNDNGNFKGYLKNIGPSFYKKDIPLIKMESFSINPRILRVKISDAAKERYEPKIPIRSDKQLYGEKVSDPMYRFETDPSKPGFRVVRTTGDNSTIFNSIGVGGFVFADQFLQISSLLPSHYIYGIGEHRSHLKLNTNWQSFTLFNKDQPPTENANLYGSHPFYLIMEESGEAHGVLFLNSNAMDVILQPTPGITFRTVGGIFDIYFLMGPTPDQVIRSYSEIVGKPFMPPYWSLGFHLCRFGYESLEKTKEVWNRTRAVKIPLDTQWNDLDYMDKRNDFTYDKEKFKDLPKFVDELHELGMHYIPLIDPGVSGSEKKGSYLPYDEGLRLDIFIKDANTNQPFVGKVWNKVSTVWPDFTNPKAQDYWMQMMKEMHSNFKYDGAWIDMNEPSNFFNGAANGCTKNPWDYPPYTPNVVGNLLATKTVCMDAKHFEGLHYNVHNTYGAFEAQATNMALKSIRNKRPFIVSRASWVGLGTYAGSWTADIYSSWYDMRMSIPEILAFSFYQIPMVGADICGFDGNATESLCNRWMQLGAFYPFSRNHNSDDAIDQDPVAMGDLVVKSSRKALMIRYRFLPYLYTLFFHAHAFGDTVARPLFVEFPEDRKTWDIDTQFLWGSSFMIIPILEDDKTEIIAYVPRGIWYDFYTKRMMSSGGQHFLIEAPLDTIPILIRGGAILPAQVPNVTTTESRKNKFELFAALNEFGAAYGYMYWDDGDSLDSFEQKQYKYFMFKLQNQRLYSLSIKDGQYNEKMSLGKVEILGVRQVSEVTVNDVKVNFTYDPERYYLKVKDLNVDLQDKFVLSWK